jgi:hypothetical protein
MENDDKTGMFFNAFLENGVLRILHTDGTARVQIICPDGKHIFIHVFADTSAGIPWYAMFRGLSSGAIEVN